MNFSEFLESNGYQTKELEYSEYYKAMIKCLGFDNVRICIPFDKGEIKEAYDKDMHLNTLDYNIWCSYAGFSTIRLKNGCEERGCIKSKLRTLLRNNGINSYSPSNGVSLLKTAALMWLGVI